MKRKKRKEKDLKNIDLIDIYLNPKFNNKRKAKLFQIFSKNSRSKIDGLSWFESAKNSFRFEIITSILAIAYLLLKLQISDKLMICSILFWFIYLIYHKIRILEPPANKKSKIIWMDRVGKIMATFYFLSGFIVFISCILIQHNSFTKVPILPLNIGGGILSILYHFFSVDNNLGAPLLLLGSLGIMIYTFIIMMSMFRPSLLFSNSITDLGSITSNSTPLFFLGLIASIFPMHNFLLYLLILIGIALTLNLYSRFHAPSNFRMNTVRGICLFMINPKRLLFTISGILESDKGAKNARKILDKLEVENNYHVIRKLNSEIISRYNPKSPKSNNLIYLFLIPFILLTLSILYEGLLLDSKLYIKLKEILCSWFNLYCK